MENKSNEIKEGCKRMQINDTKAGMQTNIAIDQSQNELHSKNLLSNVGERRREEQRCSDNDQQLTQIRLV